MFKSEKNIVLIAGFTSSKNLAVIKDYFKNQNIVFMCAYTRPPMSDFKKGYLEKFDDTFDLTIKGETERLSKIKKKILLVTCTQERDMEVYVDILFYVGKINESERELYKKVNNKKDFKEELSKEYPELVPQYKVVTEELLGKLDTLSYPQVVKPTGLSGSSFVHIVHTPGEFLDFYKTYETELKENSKIFFDRDSTIISEDFVEGPQYSINVYVNSSMQITTCPILRVVPASEIGENDTYSVYQRTLQDELGTTELDLLQSALEKIVKHFSIKNTSAHFDAVLTKDGWKFLEVGLRIGGKRHKIFELSHGFSHLENDLENRMEKTIVISEQKTHVCIVQKASKKAGILKGIEYTREAISEKNPLIMEDKLSKIGKEVAPVSLGGGTIARFIIKGKEYDAVLALSKKMFESTKFDVS